MILITEFHLFLYSPILAYDKLVGDGSEDVTVFASSQKALSFLRKYYDSSYGVFPHLTAIIDVKDGVSEKDLIIMLIVSFYS